MNNLPTWMQWFSFVVAVVLALFQIGNLINRPVLRIRLTSEIFFRISNWGETIFVSAVYLSQNGANEIQSIEFLLEKQDSPIKSYDLEVMYVGGKKVSSGNMADFNFTTKSTVFLIPKDQYGLTVFMLRQPNYNKEIERALEDFTNQINEIKSEHRVPSRAQTTQELFTTITNETKPIVDRIAPKIVGNIQLEPGKYKLRATARYISFGTIPFRRSKTAVSEIEFLAAQNLKTKYEESIEKYLWDLAENIFFNEQRPLGLPEYNPESIVEISSLA